MGEITLRKALDDYKTIYMPYRNFAERTREEYLNDLEDLTQFLEHLGIKEVRDIGLPHLERYLAELDHRGVAASTRKRKVVSIRAFLWYLYQDQYISINLAKRLIPPIAEAKSPRYLTITEYERLLEAATGAPRDFALLQIVLQAGIKLSELIQLTVMDVELPSNLHLEMNALGHLHIRGSERRKGRMLSLNTKACIALDSYLRRRVQTTAPALFTNRFGKPISPRGVEKIVRMYLSKAGINNANVQSLRHTFAIHQLSRGTDVSTIQSFMGYKDPRSMSSYLSIVPEVISHDPQEKIL